MKFQEELTALDACSEAIEWVGDKTFTEVWATCDRGDWLAWYCEKIGLPKRLLVAIGAECAALALPYMTDQHSINCVEVCRRYGRGEATEEELEASKRGAKAARTDSDLYVDSLAAAEYISFAAGDSVNATARAGRAAVCAAFHAITYLPSTCTRSADAAADAAAAAVAAVAAVAADIGTQSAYYTAFAEAAVSARSETLRQCADIIRRMVPVENLNQQLTRP